MFEGKTSHNGHGVGSSGDAGSEERLRKVAWGELVSRLAAARDLRWEMAVSASSGEASFDAESAKRIAARSDGKPEINRDDLGDGKDAGAKKSNGLSDSNTGDRGRE